MATAGRKAASASASAGGEGAGVSWKGFLLGPSPHLKDPGKGWVLL